MAVKLVTQETLTDCGLACVAMVSGQSLATVRKVAIKELGYPKDGPYTTTHENLFKLLAHFGIGHGKKAPFKSLAAMPSLAIMETRKMPSTGNSHLVVFERLPDGDERVLDPGFWLKQQERRDWNRIKLDTFVPVLLSEQAGSPKKGTKKAEAEVVESASPDVKTAGEAKGKPAKTARVKAAAGKPKPAAKKKAPVTPTGSAEGGGASPASEPTSPGAFAGDTSEETATESGTGNESSE
ncbi:hypothetical protein DZC30_02515 [Comamonas testosteroni]|uniref:Peptidase C39 domain-containing protein n=1 Tax=Comamonas testosteroni TaxID=285 RepID=A0A373FTE3_COMTE|nr:hypothetical protein [Comamonas testosteroni]RGE46669.1 hypothetical protein DZC30_02515 [Comamonas testosteroni]